MMVMMMMVLVMENESFGGSVAQGPEHYDHGHIHLRDHKRTETSLIIHAISSITSIVITLTMTTEALHARPD